VPEILPQPRIDSLVRRPDGTEVRRTEYAGAVWPQGRPLIEDAMTIRPNPGIPRGITLPNFDLAFYLPDSLPYVWKQVAEEPLQVTAALQGSGEVGAVVHATASWVQDRSGTPTWIQLRLVGHLGWQGGISYRVVALTAPDAVVRVKEA
jgi:hypothetical protein